VSSCSSQKSVDDPRRLTIADFERGPAHVQERECELSAVLTPAEDLYTGLQHKRLMQGVIAVREGRMDKNLNIDLWILSAGYGLVPGSQMIAPYDVTFANMPKSDVRRWAEHQGVPTAFRDRMNQRYDLRVVLLGSKYLDACSLEPDLDVVPPTVFLTSTNAAKRLAQVLPAALIWPLSNNEARLLRCPLVGIKGEVTKRLLFAVGRRGFQHLPMDLGTFLAETAESPCQRTAASSSLMVGVNDH
jgi:hypothetical protein